MPCHSQLPQTSCIGLAVLHCHVQLFTALPEAQLHVFADFFQVKLWYNTSVCFINDTVFVACAQIWQCEFCEERNIVDILPEEIPKLADVTYMLKPAPSTTATSCGGVDESMVVFCIDNSGSMCVSQQVCTV